MPHRLHRRSAVALISSALVAGLLGCSSPAEAPPTGVSVSIQQNRDDYGPRRIEIVVDNASDAPLEIWEARLDSAAFRHPAWTRGTTTVRAGTATALRLDLEAADCSAEVPPAPSASVRLAWTQRAAHGVVDIVPADPFGTIARVHAQDCLADEVADVASITPREEVSVTEEAGVAVAHLTIDIVPTGAPGSVRIDAIDRTVLLRPASGAGSWPVQATVDAASGPVTVELDVLPSNCSTHTVSEDKRGTFFPVRVVTGAGTEGVVSVGVSRAVRGAFYEYIASDHCRWTD